MKAIEQDFREALFIMLYKVVVTCKSADETLECDQLNERSAVESNFRVILIIVLCNMILTERCRWVII